MMFRSLCLMALCASATAVVAGSRATVSPVHLPQLPLGVVNFPSGKAFNLTVGIGSGAFHDPGSAQARVWTITDRGPSVACSDAPKLLGLEVKTICAGDETGRILPLPGFTPTIYGFDLRAGAAASVAVTLPLKGRSGRPVTGLANPPGPAPAEANFDTEGRKLAPNPSGLDPRALVRLSDGTFWVADSYGPSVLRVDADGTVLKRLVPKGAASALAGADYAVEEALPAIFARRQRDRGLEGLAVSPDENFLYLTMQGALGNPDAATAVHSANTRILKLSLATEAPVAEYLYRLDPPDAFEADAQGSVQEIAPDPFLQNAVGVSDTVAIGADKLLMLERLDRGARFYAVDLHDTAEIPALYDDPAASPSLESLDLAALAGHGLKPLHKTLVLDGNTTKGLPRKLAGLALLSDRALIVLNDNDFGITGDENRMLKLQFRSRIFK